MEEVSMKNKFLMCVCLMLLSLTFFSVDAAMPTLQQKLTQTKSSLQMLQQKLQSLQAALSNLQYQLQPAIEIPYTFDYTFGQPSGTLTITLSGTDYAFPGIPPRQAPNRLEIIHNAIKQKFDTDPVFNQKLAATGTSLLSPQKNGVSKRIGGGQHHQHHGHHGPRHQFHHGQKGQLKLWLSGVLMAVRDRKVPTFSTTQATGHQQQSQWHGHHHKHQGGLRGAQPQPGMVGGKPYGKHRRGK
jgi:hypothetical protein